MKRVRPGLGVGGYSSGPPQRLPDDSVCFSSDFCFSSSNVSAIPCLSREMSKLSLASQEKVVQDILGIAHTSCTTTSTAESSREDDNQSLKQLQEELNLISLEDKKAYSMVVSQNSAFALRPDFQRMFLRAAQGDAKRAAKRLVKHFETKLQLFGIEKLGKDITLDDLSEDDMEALESGGFQVLKRPDIAGRSVLLGRYTSMKYKSIDNMLRALWYIWMAIIENETNQLKGVIAVGYENGKVPLERFDTNLEEKKDDDDIIDSNDAFDLLSIAGTGGFDKELARKIVTIPLSLPIRPVGYHLSTDSEQWIGLLDMVMVTLCKFIRLRMKIHHGSPQECLYALMTSGVPSDCIPVTSNGDMDLTNHLEWIEKRRLIEKERSLMEM